MTLAETLQDLRDQLSWRGPGGQPQGRIVIGRDQAEQLLAALSPTAPQATTPAQAILEAARSPKEGRG